MGVQYIYTKRRRNWSQHMNSQFSDQFPVHLFFLFYEADVEIEKRQKNKIHYLSNCFK